MAKAMFLSIGHLSAYYDGQYRAKLFTRKEGSSVLFTFLSVCVGGQLVNGRKAGRLDPELLTAV